MKIPESLASNLSCATSSSSVHAPWLDARIRVFLIVLFQTLIKFLPLLPWRYTPFVWLVEPHKIVCWLSLLRNISYLLLVVRCTDPQQLVSKHINPLCNISFLLSQHFLYILCVWFLKHFNISFHTSQSQTTFSLTKLRLLFILQNNMFWAKLNCWTHFFFFFFPI